MLLKSKNIMELGCEEWLTCTAYTRCKSYNQMHGGRGHRGGQEEKYIIINGTGELVEISSVAIFCCSYYQFVFPMSFLLGNIFMWECYTTFENVLVYV